jgi:hypothetical protein
VHETVQWLPDAGGAAANRIVHQDTTRLCRDSEGRTRQEVERGGRRLVYLRDPVANESWVLDPQRKTARQTSVRGSATSAPVDATLWQDYAERMREWARGAAEAARRSHGAAMPPPAAVAPPAPPVHQAPAASPAPPEATAPGTAPVPPVGSAAPGAVAPAQPVLVTRVARGDGKEAEVTVLRSAGASALEHPVPPPLMPPAVQMRAHTLAPRGAGVTTALGGRDFDGVRAHGERTVWTIEAGRIGNEKPIQIVREVWTAPDLLLTVMSRDFDPRSGEIHYRLRNLKRAEPEPELMRVPEEYSRSGRGSAPRASAPRG